MILEVLPPDMGLTAERWEFLYLAVLVVIFSLGVHIGVKV